MQNRHSILLHFFAFIALAGCDRLNPTAEECRLIRLHTY